MREQIKKTIKNMPLLAIPAVIVGKILPGFVQYCKLIKKYGSDVSILRTAWHGTGDYYICGMYLPEYLKQNRISNYIFLVKTHSSEAKVTELFDGYKGHTEALESAEELSRFSEFMQSPTPLCKSFECSEQLAFIGEHLKGYRGLSLADFYKWYGFGFQSEPMKAEPHFTEDIHKIRIAMEKMGLPHGKTVLLSPFSTCSKAYLPPDSVWRNIAQHLKAQGYSVATNCFGSERPVEGTVPVAIPYKELVPFLNEAGGFIGIRSGLCDILSKSSCRKIVIHPERSDYWPDGSALKFVGMRAMGLDENISELLYTNDNKLITDVIDSIEHWKL